jgi:hypothetical protein
MKKLFVGIIISLFLIIYSLSGFVNGQNPDNKECITVYNQCLELIKDNKTQKISYYKNCGTNNFGKIKMFDTSKSGDWICEIDLFVNNGKLRVISYVDSDPGGDTALYLNYYFRLDGSTAYIEKDDRILSGYDQKTFSKVYLNSNGKVIDFEVKVYDLNTKQEKKDMNNTKGEIPKEVYKNVNEIITKNNIPFKEQ